MRCATGVKYTGSANTYLVASAPATSVLLLHSDELTWPVPMPMPLPRSTEVQITSVELFRL